MEQLDLFPETKREGKVMGTKNNPGKYDCYAKAEPDEPIFVLLGRDPLAAALVDEWIALSEYRDITNGIDESINLEKYTEAENCAHAMYNYCASLGKQPCSSIAERWGSRFLAQADTEHLITELEHRGYRIPRTQS